MTGLDITAVASANQFVRNNLTGGRRSANAACAGAKPIDESAYPTRTMASRRDRTHYGRFRTVDLGDLTWNGELDLMCPANRIGTVDLYLTSHHGLEKIGFPRTRAGAPSARGGDEQLYAERWRAGGSLAVLQDTVGIQDLWQLHWSYNAGLEKCARTVHRQRRRAGDDRIGAHHPITDTRRPARRRPRGARIRTRSRSWWTRWNRCAGWAWWTGRPWGTRDGRPRRCRRARCGWGGGPGRGPGGPGGAAHTPAYVIKVTAQQDGTFTVTNTRNNFRDVSAAAVARSCPGRRSTTPSANRLLSTAVAALPVVTLFFVLVVLKKRVWVAAVSGFVVAVTLALLVFGMPPALVSAAAVHGVVFGLVRIAWIIVASIFLYNIAVRNRPVSGDEGIDCRPVLRFAPAAILIAFCFGAFLEGTGGGGAPVAIAGAFLIGLGFPPFQAAVLCLVANTAPVAWGGVGNPIRVLAGVTGLPEHSLNAMTGRILPPFSFILPLWLVRSMVDWKKTFEVFPALLVCGLSFAAMQFYWSNFLETGLVDIASAISLCWSWWRSSRFGRRPR